MCTLSPYNINQVDSLLDFANKIGWYLAIAPAHINQRKINLNFRGFDKNFISKNKDKKNKDIKK